jgi:crotonobetainyl-CoA:carnitine CoA-transferase CaiB-like acyl-CoA transferase
LPHPSALPLTGLRVVDLSDRLAGSYCTKLLIDAGATVTKVESPAGDPLRRWSSGGNVGQDGDPDSALFRYLCASTDSVVVDFDDPVDVDKVRELAAGADIVVETWIPGVAEARGLGADDLRARNPALVVASISAFGRGGPRSGEDLPEFLLQALSGSTFDHGLPDGDPLAVPVLLGESGAGAFAAVAATAARLRAANTGQGAHVDTSILESLATTHSPGPVVFSRLLGVPAMRFKGAPVPCNEPTSDGWVGFYALSAQQWHDFAAMVGDEALLADEDLTNLLVRIFKTAEVRPRIQAWTKAHTTDEILELAQLFRVPSAPLATGASLPDMDYVRDRELLVANPRGGFRQPRPIFRWGDHTDREVLPAPTLTDRTFVADLAAPNRADHEARFVETKPAPPLHGVRVLDLTSFWAGPFGTEILVALGADVIKIESIQRPDGFRFSSFAPPTDPAWFEKSHMVNAVNLGKRDVTLDLGSVEGRDLFLRLVATADVVVENFTPRVMDQFNLGYDVLRAAREDIIFVRAPAFGLDGPWRDRPGFAVTVEQASGLAWITGYIDGEPLPANGPFDPIAGTHAAFSVVAALDHRRRTGEGQIVEVPMIDIALTSASEIILEQDAYGHGLERMGNRSLNAAPQGVYCSEEDNTWIALSAQTDAQWSALADLLGREDLRSDVDLQSLKGRVARHDELDTAIAAWAAQRKRDEAIDQLTTAGVPAAPVLPPDRINEDPQMVARGFWQDITHRAIGTHPFSGMPFAREGEHWYPGPAPFLGEHNEELLGNELGLNAEDLERLREAKVIGTRPVGLD